MAISATYTPTVTLLLSATNQIGWVTRENWLLYGFFSGVPILLLLYLWYMGKLFSAETLGFPSWAFFSAIAVLMPALTHWFRYKQISANLKSNPSARGPHNFHFSDEGIELTGDGANGSIAWKNIVKVRISRSFLLLFFSKSCAHVVPKELLSETEIDQIKAWHSSAV